MTTGIVALVGTYDLVTADDVRTISWAASMRWHWRCDQLVVVGAAAGTWSLAERRYIWQSIRGVARYDAAAGDDGVAAWLHERRPAIVVVSGDPYLPAAAWYPMVEECGGRLVYAPRHQHALDATYPPDVAING